MVAAAAWWCCAKGFGLCCLQSARIDATAFKTCCVAGACGGGPKLGRQRVMEGKPPLLEGWSIYLAGKARARAGGCAQILERSLLVVHPAFGPQVPAASWLVRVCDLLAGGSTCCTPHAQQGLNTRLSPCASVNPTSPICLCHSTPNPAGPHALKEDLSVLLKAAGATCFTRLPVQVAGGKCPPAHKVLFLVDAEQVAGGKGEVSDCVRIFASVHGVSLLRKDWLMDSVSCQSLLPQAAYIWQAG